MKWIIDLQRYLGLAEFNEKQNYCSIDLIDLCPSKEIDRQFIEMMASEVMGMLHKEVYGFLCVCFSQ